MIANNVRKSAKATAVLLSLGLTLSAGQTGAALSMSNVPLFLGGAVDPIVVFSIDDASGSMGWSFSPESIGDPKLRPNRRGLAVEWNALAYNPATIYPVPPGRSAPGAGFAFVDGYAASLETVSLASYDPSWEGDGDYWPVDEVSPQSAYYYVFYKNHSSGAPSPRDPSDPATGMVGAQEDGVCPTTADEVDQLADDDCYRYVMVGTDEQANFANWYSFYRKRMYVAKAGAAYTFANLADGVKAGLWSIDSGKMTDVLRLDAAVAPTTQRDKLINELYGLTVNSSGTSPLRLRYSEVGEYLLSNSASLWDVSCRRAANVVMTDAEWGGEAPSPEVLDCDQSSTCSRGYSAKSPFPGVGSDTLADVAMKYWATDLYAPETNDNVPVSLIDPANWQHLSLFAVGVGVLQTSISASDAFAAIFSGASVLWEDPITVLSARVDDFLHAAVNSRGEFLNVKDWEDLVAALGRTVLNSPGSAGSSASVVLNSGALRDETRLYQARFISDTWGGELLAYEINADGSVGRLIWEAGDVLTASGASGRKIYTYDRTTKKGIEFFAANDGAFNALPKAIRDAVGTREVLDYLRGDRSKEVANGGTYRNRKTLLGDLISSAPAFVGVPTAPYPDEWCTEIDNNGNCNSVPEDGVPYSTSFRFAPANLTRPQVIYVGSNDGMLHAFEVGTWNASAQKWVDGTGMELFAYIPSSAFSTTGKPNIGSLASTSYVHTYFADGSPTVVDAFVNGEWRTVLVAGLGGGGRGIYALDVTDPTAPKVMWEFTDANDADLGYTFSRPNIVRLNNDKWAVVFGNGYNSGSDKAYLYVRDIVDGSSIAKIAAGSATGNGLSTVSPVDEDGDFTADLVYAGDLKGNLWKFTLRGKNTGKWVVSGPNGSTTTPIFSATSPSTGTPAQPITSRPQVIAHPYGGGFIVLFGTGKFLESSDLDTPQATQSYYGIWDTYDNDDSKKDGNQYNHGAQKVTRSDLLTQEILAEPTANGYVYRLTTNSVPKWKAVGAAGTGTHLGWHLDLVLKGAASNFGERQVSDSVVRSGRTIFTTLIPPVAQSGASDPCKFGGEGWLMELNAVTGARMEFSPFDVNGDGVFNLGWEAGKPTGDAFDLSGKPVAASGRKSAVGIIPTPAILARPDGGKEYKYVAGSKGSIDMIVESAGASDFGRQSWRQLFK